MAFPTTSTAHKARIAAHLGHSQQPPQAAYPAATMQTSYQKNTSPTRGNMDGFALRATTKRGGLPSGFAAGMARRRFDLKVELQAIRLPFDIPAPSTFVKRRRAIPTFGSRQAPRHEPGFARHEYPRISPLPTLFPRCVFLDRINRIYKILAVCKCFWRFHNPDNPVNPVQKKFCNCRK